MVWSIGVHRGPLRQAIAALKYRGEYHRAQPLGRLLAAYLMERAPCFEDVDLIVAMAGGHTMAILVAAAHYLGGMWPLDLPPAGPVLVKRSATRPMVTLPSAAARRLWAAGELRAALAVTDPGRVAGRRVLVVDDVFTDGSTLREVAGTLRRAGAVAVSGVVLARTPMYPRGKGPGRSAGKV